MEKTIFCVLGLFFLNSLHCAFAQEPTPHLRIKSNWSQIFYGERITLVCEIKGSGDAGWSYIWKIRGRDDRSTHNEYNIPFASASDDGEYMCIGERNPSTYTPWSNILRIKITNKPQAILGSDSTTIQSGDSVVLTCEVNLQSSGWRYVWYRGEKTSEIQTTGGDDDSNGRLEVENGGDYWCRGARGNPPYYTEYSDQVTIFRVLPNKAEVTGQPEWKELFSGERISLSCIIQNTEDDTWEYEWETTSRNRRSSRDISITVSAHSDGEYKCRGKLTTDSYSTTEWSTPVQIKVSASIPKAILGPDRTTIQSGYGAVLTCEVNLQSSGWRYVWYKGEKTSEIQIREGDDRPNGRLRVKNGGDYWCRGARGNPPYYTEYSDQVTITRILLNEAVVTGQPEWKELYSGERISLRCIIQNAEADTWEYEWGTTSSDRSFTAQTSRDISITVSTLSDGEYRCRGKLRADSYSTTAWSTPVQIKVSAGKPNAELSADNLGIPPGGNVTLTCSVRQSSGWKYYFYHQSSASASKTQFLSSSGQITFSEVGLYSCRGFRGDPAYSTGESQTITIHKNNKAKAVVTLQPPWTEFYSGEKITLTCEIGDGEDSEWKFEWDITSSHKPFLFPKRKKITTEHAATSHSGNYRCKGIKTADQSLTNWSDSVTLTVLYSPPRPVLSVSPSWPSPGDSVTLTCVLKHPSDGWRFFWYKAVPKPPGYSYNHELLSESRNGTEHRSYIVHGWTQTTAYVCRAGRGNKLYTKYSDPQFVWSGDIHSSASLTVTPDSVQHLISDSVSLRCSGNSSQWRVRSFQKHSLSVCSEWDETIGSTCTIETYSARSGVFWCESASGEFSNAVNITKNNYDIILVSPVKPVTEKSSVILRCKLRKTDISSYVSFYHNDKLIQNDTRMELNISAVTKSNEGFYKCQTSGRESDQSWMSVKAVNKHGSSSFPEIPVIVVLICIIVLLILIVLLLYCHRRSKGTCFSRTTTSQNTNNAAGQKGLHGEDDVNHYDTIKAPEDNTNGRDTNQDVTYSLIEIKNMEKKRTQAEPNESMVYSAVKKKDAEEEVLVYAQVSHNNQRKDKKKAGRAKPASTEEPVYSEVKSNQK